MEQSFWHKPVGDVDVFKLLLFTIGNGCPPSFISEWIMLSQSGADPDRGESGLSHGQIFPLRISWG